MNTFKHVISFKHLLVLVSACLVTACQSEMVPNKGAPGSQRLIVNGYTAGDATKRTMNSVVRTEYSLRYGGTSRGTGMVTGCRTAVVTAAHNIPDSTRPGNLKFRFVTGEVISAKRIELAPSSGDPNHDLAVVTLDEPAPAATRLQQINVSAPSSVWKDKPLTIYGYGLQKAYTDLERANLSDEEIAAIPLQYGWGNYVGVTSDEAADRNQLLVTRATKDYGSNAGPGDSGGPVSFLTGVVGFAHGVSNEKGVARTAYASVYYNLDWLAEALQSACDTKKRLICTPTAREASIPNTVHLSEIDPATGECRLVSELVPQTPSSPSSESLERYNGIYDLLLLETFPKTTAPTMPTVIPPTSPTVIPSKLPTAIPPALPPAPRAL